jgi:hypothetical protein
MQSSRRVASLVIGLVLVISALVWNAPPLAAANENGQCSLKTIKGSYAAQTSGWIGSGPTRLAYAAAGVTIQDGVGGITGFLTFSIDGDVTENVPLVGTYTVDAASCTGHAEANIGSFFFAIADNGKQTRIVGTSPGTTVVGESIRQ